MVDLSQLHICIGLCLALHRNDCVLHSAVGDSEKHHFFTGESPAGETGNQDGGGGCVGVWHLLAAVLRLQLLLSAPDGFGVGFYSWL